MEPHVRLRWTSHQGTVLSMFDALLSTESLVDVTLACEGQHLRAHKVVLSACSPYFQELLSLKGNKKAIVFLKDVKYTELKALMNYMYRGEVNIPQHELPSFLAVAQALKIRGLADIESSSGASAPNNYTSDELFLVPTEPPVAVAPAATPQANPPCSASNPVHPQSNLTRNRSVPLTAAAPRPTPNRSHVQKDEEPHPIVLGPKSSQARITRSSTAASSTPPTKRSRVDDTHKPIQSPEVDPFAGIPMPSDPLATEEYNSSVGEYIGLLEAIPTQSADPALPVKIEGSTVLAQTVDLELDDNGDIDMDNSIMSHLSWGEEGEDEKTEEQRQHGEEDNGEVAGPSSSSRSQPAADDDGDGNSKDYHYSRGIWQCGKCRKTYTSKGSLKRHLFGCGLPSRFTCAFCGDFKSFRSDNFKRHTLMCKRKLQSGS